MERYLTLYVQGPSYIPGTRTETLHRDLNVHPATLLMPDISPQARVTLTVGPGRAAAAAGGRSGPIQNEPVHRFRKNLKMHVHEKNMHFKVFQ